MINTYRIREQAKKKGIKLSFICEQLGLQRSYINNIERGKASMSDDRIYKVALLLGTSYEYLTNQTDDPKMLENEEAIKASHEVIVDSAGKLLARIEDIQNLSKIVEKDEEIILKSEIIELLNDTHNVQTLKMIKAALEAAKKE